MRLWNCSLTGPFGETSTQALPASSGSGVKHSRMALEIVFRDGEKKCGVRALLQIVTRKRPALFRAEGAWRTIEGYKAMHAIRKSLID